MNNKIITFAASILTAGILVSCTSETNLQHGDDPMESGRTVTVHANIRDGSTKVSLTQYESSLDMLARWDDDDVVKTFLA